MDGTNERSTVNTAPLERISTRPSRRLNVRMVQNFSLIWLDASIDEINNDGSRNTITKLRQVVNAVNTFVGVDECADFISDLKEEKVFMIVSDALGQITVPMVHDMPQLIAVYILCGNRARHEQWAKNWAKVIGIFTDITPICESLRHATQQLDHNFVSISFVKSSDATSNKDLDQLDQSFMYTQILKEILLTINFEQKHFNEFLAYCREQFAGNTTELKNIDKLEREYRHHTPIWWYTYPCCLYSMLNRALRAMEVDLIMKMGFFVRDLYEHIAALHSEQYSEHLHLESFTVYRGQHLSETDFDQLMKTQGGLLSFNNFLSTSRDRAISFAFAESYIYNPSMVGVVFQIRIDPSITSTSFASIRNVSNYQTEDEILLSMHSIFRVGQIKRIDRNDRFWQVDLTLTSDNDPELNALTEHIRKETLLYQEGWYRLANFLIKLGQFDKAQQVCEVIFDQSSTEIEKADIYYMLGMIKHDQGKYSAAIEFHERAFKIRQKTLPKNHPDLATSYNNIGSVYEKMGEYSKALSYYEKALEIYQITLPANHPALATSYNNIGLVYWNMGEYSKALSYYEKALEIRQKTLPANHPSLATSYNNIGSVYENMGEYSKALSYYEKALEIYQKTLPANHPDLANSYNNIGSVYANMGEYSKALSYYERALEIRHKTLPANHPLLATSYNNIGGVYDSMGEYSKALAYLEKALEIKRKSLPQNHPNLASSCSNIGLLYYKMGEYSKALSFLEKAVDIFQKTLPANHPILAIPCNNIALVYDNMGEYSQALSFHEKALEIRRESLPSNHSDLAITYNNMGLVYDNLDDCSQALSYHEKALEIYKETLSPNHPHLAACYNNMGEVYLKRKEYLKSLSYYERALNIQQRSLPPNHPNIRTVKENIEKIKKKL